MYRRSGNSIGAAPLGGVQQVGGGGPSRTYSWRRAGVQMVGPGSGEIYKRDNLLGPEAVEACFYGTSWCTRCRECAPGTGAASVRRCCNRRLVVLLAARERGTGGHRSRYVREFTGHARIVNLRHGRNGREPREGPGRHAALTISRVAPLTLH